MTGESLATMRERVQSPEAMTSVSINSKGRDKQPTGRHPRVNCSNVFKYVKDADPYERYEGLKGGLAKGGRKTCGHCDGSVTGVADCRDKRRPQRWRPSSS